MLWKLELITLNLQIDDLKRGLKDFNRYNGYAVAVCAMSGANKPVDFITC